jgi:hypothetical protein
MENRSIFPAVGTAVWAREALTPFTQHLSKPGAALTLRAMKFQLYAGCAVALSADSSAPAVVLMDADVLPPITVVNRQ